MRARPIRFADQGDRLELARGRANRAELLAICRLIVRAITARFRGNLLEVEPHDDTAGPGAGGAAQSRGARSPPIMKTRIKTARRWSDTAPDAVHVPNSGLQVARPLLDRSNALSARWRNSGSHTRGAAPATGRLSPSTIE